MSAEGDYVLGTHDAEVARLGRQHLAWREAMLGAWRRAGLGPGCRVLDVGAGPGWATWDLAEVVGPAGLVTAVERSERFNAVLAGECVRRRLAQVRVCPGDLMELSGQPGHDLAWCRWVASFVPSVPRLVEWLRESLRTGGRVVFHEYASYGTWQFAPPRPRLQDLVAQVMASWRASQGEPDVAPALIEALRAEGFRIQEARPHLFTTRPGELAWRWPAGFISLHAPRLVELGLVTADWADAVLAELAAAEADPASLMVTPLVLEVIAERR